LESILILIPKQYRRAHGNGRTVTRVNQDTHDRTDEPLPVARRTFVRLAGAGLLAGGATGVAAADDADGRGGTGGRPTVAVSAPDCGTLRVEYVRGNPPVRVFVSGPEEFTIGLDAENRSASRSVDAGEYEVTAKPGRGGSKGNPAVVVEGSPVTVAACEDAADPNRVQPRDLSAAFQCTRRMAGTYTLTNPRSVDATVTVVGSYQDRGFEESYVVPAGSTITVPPDKAYVADGNWTHTFTATLDDGQGTALPVNGEPVWTNQPDCS
jgi:hypothetical protein